MLDVWLETCLIRLSFLHGKLLWFHKDTTTSCFTLMCHHMCWAQETWGGHSEESWHNKDWACFHSCRTSPADKYFPTERKAGKCFLCCRDRRIENSRQSPSLSGSMLSISGEWDWEEGGAPSPQTCHLVCQHNQVRRGDWVTAIT